MRLEEASARRAATAQRHTSATTAETLGDFHAAGVLSAARLALKRLTRSKALLLAVGLGMLVAVVLVCAVPLYDSLTANIQLQRVLSTSDPVQRNFEVVVQSAQVDSQLRSTAGPQVSSLRDRYLSGFTSATPTYYVTADNMLVARIGATSYDLSSTATPVIAFRAFDFAAIRPYMHVIAGMIPQSTGGGMPQALITPDMAKYQHLGVGGTVTVTQYGDHTHSLTVKIAGIWQPSNAQDPFWNGTSFATGGGGNGPPVYPVLLTYDDFFAHLSQFAGLNMFQHWIYYTQIQHLTVGNLGTVVGDAGTFRSSVNGNLLAINGITQATVESALQTLLGNVQQQEDLLALPLYVIAVQVVGLALLFVAAMADLLVEGQSQDIATLKSRGLSGSQILGIYITQGTLLGVVAVIVGPVVAGVLSVALVQRFLGTQSTSGLGSLLAQLASPQAALVPAIAGALLGIATMALAALQAARLDILAFRREQARPSRQPFWRRYYLDVGLAVLCAIGYYELNQFGGTGTRLAVTSTGSNPLLLAAPALLLLAGALIILRLVPLAAAAGQRLSARGRGITSVLAFAQVERNSGRYTRMTLLLVLAVGLGLFALTFNATLTRNASDRAAYSVGADLRTIQNTAEAGSSGQQIAARLQALPGALAVTGVYRTTDSTTSDLGDQSVSVLAIDPSTFAGVVEPVAWRADFAGQPLDTMLAQMQAHLSGKNAGTPAHPIWALVSQTFADQLHLGVGNPFALQVNEANLSPENFVVGAIVQEFPTLYPNSSAEGFLVVPFSDYYSSVLVTTPQASTALGPNEFWLRAAPGEQASLQHQIEARQYQLGLDVKSLQSRADALAAAESNPVGSGIRGLLLVGALTAALLAVLGSVVQSLLAARQRTTQFAILRTIGMANQQLTGLLLGEQIVVYLFGLVGGTVLGLLLTGATLPFLQFSDTTVDPNTIGIPPYLIVFDPRNMLLFYVALLIAFVVALAIAARYAATVGLGKALRLGED